MNEFSAGEIVNFLQNQTYRSHVVGDVERSVTEIRSVLDSNESSLSFIRNLSYLQSEVLSSLRGTVLAPLESLSFVESRPLRATWILVESPEAAFYEALKCLLMSEQTPTIDESAVIDPSVDVSKGVSVGALSFIGPNVSLGHAVRIGAGCTLRHCIVEDSVVIQDGVRIGGEPLGVVKRPDGTWVDRPSLRGVHIGKGSRIEDNTVVQRGFLTDTHIQENVRVGPNCSIGNGVTIGRGTLIAQSVVIAGSVKIGEGCSIWGNVSIREGRLITSGCTVGMGSVVVDDLLENATYVGVPAHRIR